MLRPRFEWKLRTQTLPLGERTLVMGVLNVTPDSFSDGGRFPSLAAAVECSLAMFQQGAAIVDIGGESTRPGRRPSVSAGEEIDRVIPVIEEVRKHRPQAILSVDTYKAATAEAALRSGVEIVNDVSAFLWDPAMAPLCSAANCGVVLTHTRGRPEEWRTLPKLIDAEVVPLVKRELNQRLEEAIQAGISTERIVLDPGFGFGKVGHSNYHLLAGLPELKALGQPLLVGVSRKAFLGSVLAPFYGGSAAPVPMRGNASLAAITAAVLGGAELVRVHDVRPALEALAVADSVLDAQEAGLDGK